MHPSWTEPQKSPPAYPHKSFSFKAGIFGTPSDVLKYHVVAGANVMITELDEGIHHVGNLMGFDLTVAVAGGKVLVYDAWVTTADVDASNGVIHDIEKVLSLSFVAQRTSLKMLSRPGAANPLLLY